jgi:hypothetical protein
MELFKETIGIRNRHKRLYGAISLKSNYNEMLEQAKEIANELSKEKGVIGITLFGGLSRGYGD